jgi:hypothetical protein
MTGKSFRLALLLAAGVLALLLAVGTFSPQKAAAQIATDGVSVRPETATGGMVTPVRVTFDLTTDGLILAGEEITITLEDFDVPSDIDPAHVSIRSGSESAQVGRPAAVTVDGDSITLELGNDSDGVGMELSGSGNSVTFARAAGLKPPIAAGTYDVTVATPGGDQTKLDAFTVRATVTLSPKSGASGTKLTISGTSFADGDAEIFVSQDADTDATKPTTGVAAEVNISDGAFTTEIDVVFGGNATQFEYSANYIHVYDSEGGTADADADDNNAQGALFRFGGTVKTDEKLSKGARGIEVTLTQVPTSGDIIGVTIGDVAAQFGPAVDNNDDPVPADAARTTDGPVALDEASPATTPASGTATIKINVPAGAPSGDQPLVLLTTDNINDPNDADSDPDPLGSVMVEIVALELELNPSTVVQGMTVSLTASGFGSDGEVATLAIDDGRSGPAPTIENAAGREAVGKGRYNFNFTVPDLADGEATVTLTQTDGIIGEGKLTVAKPTITNIDPAESRVDTQVSLAGSGFPANDLIDINYDGNRVASANSNGEGSWTATITVPLSAEDTNEIVALRFASDARGAERASDPVEHTVPAGDTSYSADKALSGDTITVSGEAYDPYTAVNIKIGGINVGSGVTDPNGDFSIPVEIPIFRPGSIQTVIVTLGEDDVVSTESIEILATPPEPESNAVTDVFAAEIASGNLIVAWRYDNDTETWSYFDPNLDEADNNYTIAAAGDIVWLNLQAATTFQGKSLKGGWQLVTLQ